MKKIAIFASGTGSNFESIYKYLNTADSTSRIALIISNNPDAMIIPKAKSLQIPFSVLKKNDFTSFKEYSTAMLKLLEKYEINYIVLAGYLAKLPKLIIQQFENKIINIHPALLPSFGGKGYFGLNVHKAVIAAGVKLSGITIHFVNEKYDDGAIILQKAIDVLPEDTAESLAERILKVEHLWYPKIVNSLCNNKISINKGIVTIHEI